jgi:hypothetical protein
LSVLFGGVSFLPFKKSNIPISDIFHYYCNPPL